MRIAFKDSSIRDSCENSDIAIENFGFEKAEQLLNRYSDFEAANSLSDILVGKFIIRENLREKIIIEYFMTQEEDISIIFECQNLQNNELDDLNFKEISRIKLLKITI